MTHRPFTVQEFLDLPPTCWVLWPSNDGKRVLSPRMFDFNIETGVICTTPACLVDTTLEQALEMWKLSLDGGRTWHPFGVKVEEVS